VKVAGFRDFSEKNASQKKTQLGGWVQAQLLQSQVPRVAYAKTWRCTTPATLVKRKSRPA
jgi:hypothetical protein